MDEKKNTKDNELNTVEQNGDAQSAKTDSAKKLRLKALSVLMIVNLIVILLLAFFTILTSAKVNGLYDSMNELSALVASVSPMRQDPAFSQNPSDADEQTAVSENAESLPVQEPDAYTEDISSGGGTENAAEESTEIPQFSFQAFSPTSYAALHKADELPAPEDYSNSEVISRLRELAKTDEIYQEIYDKRNTYPYGILKNLINNPEILDHVKNYTGIRTSASGGLTEDEINTKFPLFLQWDERWGYVSYGSSMLSITGCGPTCLSMILFSLTRDESFTPDFCADYAMENGYYLAGIGTKWALFESAPEHFGVVSQKIDNEKEPVMDALQEEKMLVFSVAPGYFTSFGHFIVVYGTDEDGLLLVNDPNCVYRSTVHWNYEDIKKQIKAVWSFEKSPAS